MRAGSFLTMAGLLSALSAGCAALPLQPPVSPLSDAAGARTPIPDALATPLPAETPPPAPGRSVDLPALLDFALSHSPATRTAWAQARAAAAQLGSKRSAYYPALDATGQVGYAHQVLGGGRATFESLSYGPGVTLTWLLLDLGERGGNVDEARSLLDAANLAHDQAVLDTLFDVERAWYSLLAARALVHADEATAHEAQTQLDAAQARRAAGVATIADVLQAQTALAQAQLTLQSARGQQAVAEGALATTAGLPPTTTFEVGELPAKLPLEQSAQQVEALLKEASQRRPDLARARALAEAAAHHAAAIAAQPWPSLRLSANAARGYFPQGTQPFGDSYGAQLTLSFPLFDGFKRRYDLLQARAQADSAAAQAQGLAQQVALEVWTSYQTVQTAARRVTAASALLDSATQSEQVAQGRYTEGAGTLLDLLTAQAALASARAQEVQARTDWLVSMAALARDTGALGPPTVPTKSEASP